jgi:hypothetical protein
MHFCILYSTKKYLQFRMYLYIQVQISDGLLYVAIFPFVPLLRRINTSVW